MSSGVREGTGMPERRPEAAAVDPDTAGPAWDRMEKAVGVALPKDEAWQIVFDATTETEGRVFAAQRRAVAFCLHVLLERGETTLAQLVYLRARFALDLNPGVDAGYTPGDEHLLATEWPGGLEGGQE